MATIIVCDGGCGAQSPDPKTRLHNANGWLRVRSDVNTRFRYGDRWNDKLFCDACSPRVIKAMEPQS
jgi:hypothetical protein